MDLLPMATEHQCRCGEHDGAEPVLDARAIPHAVRHGAVFGAFDALAPGSAMQVVASHDPVPLLAQLRERTAGGVEVEYLQRGPQQWTLRLRRPA